MSFFTPIRRRAFTLLETVVAITVLGIFFTAATSTIQSSQRLLGNQYAETQLAEIAEQSQQQILSLRDQIPLGTSLATWIGSVGATPTYGILVASPVLLTPCDGGVCPPAGQGGPQQLAWCGVASSTAACNAVLDSAPEVRPATSTQGGGGNTRRLQLLQNLGAEGTPAEILAIRRTVPTGAQDARTRVDAQHPSGNTTLALYASQQADQDAYAFYNRSISFTSLGDGRFGLRIVVQDSLVPSRKYILTSTLSDPR